MVRKWTFLSQKKSFFNIFHWIGHIFVVCWFLPITNDLYFIDYRFLNLNFTEYWFLGLNFTDYQILGLHFTDYWFQRYPIEIKRYTSGNHIYIHTAVFNYMTNHVIIFLVYCCLLSHLLMYFSGLYCKQYVPRSDGSRRKSLIRLHNICFRDKISLDI